MSAWPVADLRIALGSLEPADLRPPERTSTTCGGARRRGADVRAKRAG